MYPLVPFIVQNFKKALSYELWGCATFRHKMVYFLEQKILGKNHFYYFHLPTGSFHYTKFSKNSGLIQSYVDAPFWGPKLPICSNKKFFRNHVNTPCFFHSCISTFQKSKSDINYYFNKILTKNTEVSLARIHFWPKLENQIFPRHPVFTECQ